MKKFGVIIVILTALMGACLWIYNRFLTNLVDCVNGKYDVIQKEWPV